MSSKDKGVSTPDTQFGFLNPVTFPHDLDYLGVFDKNIIFPFTISNLKRLSSMQTYSFFFFNDFSFLLISLSLYFLISFQVSIISKEMHIFRLDTDWMSQIFHIILRFMNIQKWHYKTLVALLQLLLLLLS